MQFQAKIPYKKPLWDVQTRWNSTYAMLDCAFQLKEGLIRFATLDKKCNLHPSDLNWDKLKAILDCLKVFYDATMKLSGTKYPTMNLFFSEFCEVCLSIMNMSSSTYPVIVDMGVEMYAKWDKYWSSGNMLLAIACVLDPRSKLGVVEYYMKQMYPESYGTFMNNLNNCMLALFKYYEEEASSRQSASSSQQAAGSSQQHKYFLCLTFILFISYDCHVSFLLCNICFIGQLVVHHLE